MLDFGSGKGFVNVDVKGLLSEIVSFFSSTFASSTTSSFLAVVPKENVELLVDDKFEDPKANIPPGLLASVTKR